MRPYEVMVILDPTLEDEAIESMLGRGTRVLTEHGATIHNLDKWGLRRLAYEIQHHTEGYYALWEVTAEPAAVDELDRLLRLSDEVMRHKVIRIPDEVAGRKAPAGPAPTSTESS